MLNIPFNISNQRFKIVTPKIEQNELRSVILIVVFSPHFSSWMDEKNEWKQKEKDRTLGKGR